MQAASITLSVICSTDPHSAGKHTKRRHLPSGDTDETAPGMICLFDLSQNFGEPFIVPGGKLLISSSRFFTHPVISPHLLHWLALSITQLFRAPRGYIVMTMFILSPFFKVLEMKHQLFD